MKKGLLTIQMGKAGLTKAFIKSLRKAFKYREIVKISVLRSSTRDREELQAMAKEICKALGENFTSKTIGFTIILKKWRKPRKQQK